MKKWLFSILALLFVSWASSCGSAAPNIPNQINSQTASQTPASVIRETVSNSPLFEGTANYTKTSTPVPIDTPFSFWLNTPISSPTKASFPTIQPGNSWKSIGPGGGDIPLLAIDSLTPSTLYAGTDYGDLYKSVDGGSNWNGIQNGLKGIGVLSLVIDPITPAILYAGTNSRGVFKSTDGGGQWVAANTNLEKKSISALIIDPKDTSTLYAGTSDGYLFKSTDSGVSWRMIYQDLEDMDSNPPQTISISALAIDPTSPAIIYAGTAGDGVVQSMDGGENWSSIDSGLTHPSINSLVIVPTLTTIIYAGTDGGGIFKSNNRGQNWNPMNTGLPFLTTGGKANLGYSEVCSLAMDPNTQATLYAGICNINDTNHSFSGGVFKTTDGGARWSKVSDGIPDTLVNTVAIDPGNLLHALCRNGRRRHVYKQERRREMAINAAGDPPFQYSHFGD